MEIEPPLFVFVTAYEEHAIRAFEANAVNYLMKPVRSEEHTSELQSLMRISYAVFCLKKKTNKMLSARQSTGHVHRSRSIYQDKLRIGNAQDTGYCVQCD